MAHRFGGRAVWPGDQKWRFTWVHFSILFVFSLEHGGRSLLDSDATAKGHRNGTAISASGTLPSRLVGAF